MRQFFLGRQFFYVEIVLMVVLAVVYVMLSLVGVVGLATGRGGEAAAALVLAAVGAFWCHKLWRDIQRQQRRFADPRFQGFQARKK